MTEGVGTMQQLIHEIIRQEQREMIKRANRPMAPRKEAPARLVIRLAADCDRAALDRLAALDGGTLLPGSWLLAMADGSLAAALHLDDGRVLADPFARTQGLCRVLELWATQLTGRRTRRRRWHLATS
jgi:hypothetical protein